DLLQEIHLSLLRLERFDARVISRNEAREMHDLEIDRAHVENEILVPEPLALAGDRAADIGAHHALIEPPADVKRYAQRHAVFVDGGIERGEYADLGEGDHERRVAVARRAGAEIKLRPIRAARRLLLVLRLLHVQALADLRRTLLQGG